MKISFNYEEREFIISCGMGNGKEEVFVNGTLASQKKNFIHLKSVHSFNYEGSSYEIRMQLKPIVGIISVALARNTEVVYGQDFDMKGKAFSVKKIVFPKWVYIFVVLCGIMPFLTLGGAVPALLGFGGVSLCLAISRKSNIPIFIKVVLCIGITFLCWILFFVVLLVVHSVKKT